MFFLEFDPTFVFDFPSAWSFLLVNFFVCSFLAEAAALGERLRCGAVASFFCFFFGLLSLGDDSLSSFFLFFPLLLRGDLLRGDCAIFFGSGLLPRRGDGAIFVGFGFLPRRGGDAIFFKKSMTLR